MAQNAKPLATVTEYVDYASVHGIGRIKNSPYIVLKLFWICALIASVTMTCIQLSRLAEKFGSYPINTKIELESFPDMRFPAVTVCNINPLKYAHVKNDEDLMPAIQAVAARWNIKLDDFEEDNTYDGGVYDIAKEQEFMKSTKLSGKRGSDTGIENMAEYFRIKASVEDPQIIRDYSHQLRELLVACSFNGAECDRTHFKAYRSYDFGMCYSFGVASDNQTIERNHRVFATGKDHGLILKLNVEQSQYLPFVTSSTGVVVLVHMPDKKPYEREEGIVVSPGFSTEIAVTIEEERRIAGPTNRCDINNAYDSRTDCQRDCLDDAIKNRCNCLRAVAEIEDLHGSNIDIGNTSAGGEEPSNTIDYSVDSLRPCEPNNDSMCILSAKIAQGLGEFRCLECLSPCRLTRYVTSVSTTKWPATTFVPVLEKILEEYDSAKNYTLKEIQDNMAELKIYLPSFTKQILVEEEAYTIENLLGDVGGQLGLWIGFSVLSLGEIIELFILLLTSLVQRQVQPSETNVKKLPNSLN